MGAKGITMPRMRVTFTRMREEHLSIFIDAESEAEARLKAKSMEENDEIDGDDDNWDAGDLFGNTQISVEVNGEG